MKKIKDCLRGNRGISLMELLISMAILAVLAVGFATIFLPVIKLEGKAVQLNRGNAAMATALEQVMETEEGSLPADVTDTTDEIIITFDDGTAITGTGTVVETEDPDTGAKLRTYIPDTGSS
ncbi:MAG: type II secretion system protein [Acetanaerobacterium sp.]